MKRPVVADAGPIIHLAELDRLDLVDAFENVHVTRTVLDEVDAGGRPDALETLDYTTHDVSVDSGKAGDLDAGERTAIALCESLPNPVLLTDDLAARETATTNGIEPHGTVGVIAYGANRGTIDIDEAIELMRELQSSTSLYVSDAVVEAGVRELREE